VSLCNGSIAKVGGEAKRLDNPNKKNQISLRL
jgi:hypothetical protein